MDAPLDVGVLRPIETEALRPNVYYPGLDRRVQPVLGLQVRPAKVRLWGKAAICRGMMDPAASRPCRTVSVVAQLPESGHHALRLF